MRSNRGVLRVFSLTLVSLIVFSATDASARYWRRHRHSADAQLADDAAAGSAPQAERIYANVPLPPERPAEYTAAVQPASAASAFSLLWPLQPSQPRREDYLAYAAPIEPERPHLDGVVDAPSIAGGACLAKLRAAGVEFETAGQPSAPIHACHIPTPVRVGAVSVNGRRVSLPAKPLVDCAYALQFADFADRLAAPLGHEKMHAALVAFETGPGYDCRSRNHVHGAKLSAHGLGIALDVMGFDFSDGRKVMVSGQRDAVSRSYFAALRKGACNWFTTVLGPGSDGYHEEHLHFDIEQHGRHGMHYCH